MARSSVRTAWFPLVLAFVGCTLDEDRFVQRAAKAECTIVQQCDNTLFTGLYETRPRCVESRARLWTARQREAADRGCAWQADEAKDCLSSLQRATSCEGYDVEDLFEDPCPGVWAECSAGDTGGADTAAR